MKPTTILFAAYGVFLALIGFGVTTWQFWAGMAFMVVNSVMETLSQ